MFGFMRLGLAIGGAYATIWWLISRRPTTRRPIIPSFHPIPGDDVTHRGSWSNKVGDPIYLIETTRQYGDRDPMVAVKTFPSESGFKAGIRAVEDDIKQAKRMNTRTHLGWSEETVTYRTFILRDPQWEEYPCP